MNTKTLFALSLLLTVGCGTSDDDKSDDMMDDDMMDDDMMDDDMMDDDMMDDDPMDDVTLTWDFEGLAPLGADFVYEGWVIIDGTPVSTGRFDVDAQSQPDIDSYVLTDDEFEGAEAFVLTIEPRTGDDPGPSDTKILGGDLKPNGSGNLTVDHPAALADGLSMVTGSYILETPSTAITTDYANGIWWLDPSGGPGPALDLPVLPDGWVYEGWVVTASGPMSTGRFSSPCGEDSDGAGPTAGPDGGPPFPGQDFISPPIDLVGTTVVISVEPEPDDSPLPFVLKPLVHDVVIDVGAGVLQVMANQSEVNNPGGSVAVE